MLFILETNHHFSVSLHTLVFVSLCQSIALCSGDTSCIRTSTCMLSGMPGCLYAQSRHFNLADCSWRSPKTSSHHQQVEKVMDYSWLLHYLFSTFWHHLHGTDLRLLGSRCKQRWPKDCWKVVDTHFVILHMFGHSTEENRCPKSLNVFLAFVFTCDCK